MEQLLTFLSEQCKPLDPRQFGILLFGCTAIWLVGRLESWRRWGYVCGLLSQPFWFWMLYDDKNCFVLGVSFLYLYSWIQGFRNHFLGRHTETTDYHNRIKARALDEQKTERKLLSEIYDEYFHRHPVSRPPEKKEET